VLGTQQRLESLATESAASPPPGTPLVGSSKQLVVRDHLLHEAEPLCLVGVDVLPAQVVGKRANGSPVEGQRQLGPTREEPETGPTQARSPRAAGNGEVEVSAQDNPTRPPVR